MFTLQHQKVLQKHNLTCGKATLPELLSLPDLLEFEKGLDALLSSDAFALFAVEMELMQAAMDANLDGSPMSIADIVSREQCFGERRGHRTVTSYFLEQKNEVATLIEKLKNEKSNE